MRLVKLTGAAAKYALIGIYVRFLANAVVAALLQGSTG
jgi:hypothetical protein